MVAELKAQLKEHADNQGYVFPGPIRIELEAAEDLTTGRFRVRSEAQAQVQSNATQTQVRRATALIEVNGTEHPLHPGGTVVGRGTEADIRINDPGVSRKHVEFEVAGTGENLQLRVRDLGSTNGMLVDGHRVASTGLRDGSEVRIGNTTLTVRIVTEAVGGDGVV
jgi:pSer/pThr/pTyr-binding forkhead associated (FHA) protein